MDLTWVSSGHPARSNKWACQVRYLLGSNRVSSMVVATDTPNNITLAIIHNNTNNSNNNKCLGLIHGLMARNRNNCKVGGLTELPGLIRNNSNNSSTTDIHSIIHSRWVIPKWLIPAGAPPEVRSIRATALVAFHPIHLVSQLSLHTCNKRHNNNNNNKYHNLAEPRNRDNHFHHRRRVRFLPRVPPAEQLSLKRPSNLPSLNSQRRRYLPKSRRRKVPR